jgi:RNA polymerase sigma-70 factor (ECF subfamily)
MVNAGTNSEWCESLYRTKAAAMILYGRALGLSHCEAEDVVHDTFVALMKLSEAPKAPENYCLRTLRNRALNYRRSLWRRLARQWEAANWFEPSEQSQPDELEAMARLAKLPREQREVIVLKVWNRLSFEEIGEMLEISPNTAAGRYRYGLEKLRRSAKENAYDTDERTGETAALVEATPHLVHP